jgi:hypothetical protein
MGERYAGRSPVPEGRRKESERMHEGRTVIRDLILGQLDHQRSWPPRGLKLPGHNGVPTTTSYVLGWFKGTSISCGEAEKTGMADYTSSR